MQEVTNSSTERLEREFVSRAEALTLIFRSKQYDYGSGNIAKFGIGGVLVRMSDKIERLIHLQGRGTLPQNEAIKDSYSDLAVYGVIALMCLDGVWAGVEEGGQPSPNI